MKKNILSIIFILVIMLFVASCDSATADLIYEENEEGLYVVAGVKGDKYSVRKIVIPEYHEDLTSSTAVVGIKAEAFKDCSSLTHVVISSFVKEIGDGAFENCYNLKSIVVADSNVSGDVFSVNKIGARAFKGCVRLNLVGNTYDNLTWPTRYIRFVGDEAFMGCTDLPYVHLSNDVDYIGSNAFNGCESLEYAYIGSRVKEIKDGTFEGCKSLNDVKIENGIVSIGDNAFNGCSNLKEIDIPYTVKSLGNSTFANCKNLEVVNGCENVEYIGEECFLKSRRLTNVENTRKVKKLGARAFSNTAVEEIDLSSLAEIKEQTFLDCQKLKSVKLSNSLEVIGSSAFNGCYELYDIEIPHSVKSIGEGAFYFCNSLIRLSIPAECNIAGTFIYECNRLTEVVDLSGNSELFEGQYIYSYKTTLSDSNLYEDDGLVYYLDTLERQAYVVAYIGNDNKVVIPSSVKGYPVVAVKRYAFANNKNIKEIEFGAQVEILEEGAFYNCDLLVEVTIPSNIILIEQNCFNDCDGLRIVDIKEGVAAVLEGAFYTQGLTYIHIPGSIRVFEYGAINVTELKELYVEADSSTQTAWSYLWAYESYNDEEDSEIKAEIYKNNVLELSQIIGYEVGTNHSNALEEIDGFIFERTSSVLVGYKGDNKTLVLPEKYNDSEYAIAPYAFAYNNIIEEVIIPDSVIYIGEYAFAGCESLVQVIIGKGVKTIDRYTFAYCYNLEYIEIGNNVSKILNYAFFECKSLEWIVIPESVTEIHETALTGTESLKSVFVEKDALEVKRTDRGPDFEMYDYDNGLDVIYQEHWKYLENKVPAKHLDYNEE